MLDVTHYMLNVSYLSENREFKTLKSINKIIEKYNIFENYFYVEELLFSQRTNQDNLNNEVIAFIKKNIENKYLFDYLINLLVDFILIRPKENNLACSLFTKLLSDFVDKQNYIINLIKENEFYKNSSYLQEILFSQGIIKDELQKKNQREYYIVNGIDLQNIIIEDDVNTLKHYFGSINFLPLLIMGAQFIVNDSSPTNEVFNIHKSHFDMLYISFIGFCSFYGSIECFKFLKLNNLYVQSMDIDKLSIAGGNFEIIHSLEQDGISFDHCFEVGSKYHRKEIMDWLLSNYKCEVFPLTKCLKYLNYQTFLFLLLNNINFGMETIKSLDYLSKHSNISHEIFQILLDNGADINKEVNGDYPAIYTPLGYLCKQDDLNIDLIKVFLEKGADVNKECKDKKGNIYKPLDCLRKKATDDNEEIQFLLHRYGY